MLKNHRSHSIKYLIFILLLVYNSFKNNPIYGQANIKTIHNHALVVDAHAHNLTFNENKQLDFKKLKDGGVDVVGLYFAYYPIKNSTLLSRVKSDIQQLQEQIDDGEYQLNFVSNSTQIEHFVQNGNVALIPGVEYFYGIFQNNVSTLDSLYSFGIRSITIMDNKYDKLSTENKNNNSPVDLSNFGKKIIERMNQLGMLIDISHLNDEMQKAVIEYSESPVLASHSPVRAVHDVERNIPDDILLKLKEKKGAIMITFNSGDLAGLESGRTNINSLIDHVMHAINTIGIDHVGIGSDFNGAGTRSPNGLEDASGFINITKHLAERGLSKNEIEKILGINYLNLLKRVEAFSNEQKH